MAASWKGKDLMRARPFMRSEVLRTVRLVHRRCDSAPRTTLATTSFAGRNDLGPASPYWRRDAEGACSTTFAWWLTACRWMPAQGNTGGAHRHDSRAGRPKRRTLALTPATPPGPSEVKRPIMQAGGRDCPALSQTCPQSYTPPVEAAFRPHSNHRSALPTPLLRAARAGSPAPCGRRRHRGVFGINHSVAVPDRRCPATDNSRLRRRRDSYLRLRRRDGLGLRWGLVSRLFRVAAPWIKRIRAADRGSHYRAGRAPAVTIPLSGMCHRGVRHHADLHGDLSSHDRIVAAFRSSTPPDQSRGGGRGECDCRGGRGAACHRDQEALGEEGTRRLVEVNE